MADSKYSVFCSQFLLHKTCKRGNSCLFIHARMCDIHPCTDPTEDEEFVKGFFVAPNRGRDGRPIRRHNYRRYGSGRRGDYTETVIYSLPSTSTCNSASYSTCNMENPCTSTGSIKKRPDEPIVPYRLTPEDMVPVHPKKKSDYKKKSHKMDSKNKAESSRNFVNRKGGKINVDDWVKAPEFIPKGMANATSSFANLNLDEDKSKKKLCPYAERDGICKYPVGECTYLHGNKCDFCGRGALHPYNEEQSKLHTQECIKQHERDMELSFAIARSKEKVCGICFEVIMQKSAVEQRFGILPNCNHCFCLTCIRRWRQAKQFENKIIRACPECRLTSDFVCPSSYWVDTKEEKDKVIENYKDVLSKKECKYFKKGNGRCPFGNKCFYMHALANGEKVDVGPPPSSYHVNDVTQEIDIIQRLLMLGYLRDNLTEHLDFEDILNIVDMEMLSDSDDSELFSECDDFSGAEVW